MNKQVSFMYNGSQYFTFDGSNYMATTLKTNAATMQTINSKASFGGEMKKLNDGSMRYAQDFPIVEDAKVELVDGYFNVTGKITREGKEYEVELNKDGLKFVGDEAEPEQKPEESVKPEEVPTPEPISGKVEEITEDVVQIEEPTEPTIKADVTIQPVLTITKENQEKKPVTTPKVNGKKIGFVFGERVASAQPIAVQLGIPTDVLGCVFGSTQVQQAPRAKKSIRANNGNRMKAVPKYVDNRLEEQIKEEPRRPAFTQATATKQPVVPVVQPEPKQETVAVPEEERRAIQESWGNFSPATPIGERQFESVPTGSAEDLAAKLRQQNNVPIQPVSLAKEEEPEQEQVTIDRNSEEYAQRKKEVRATFTQEVRDVIGDIPTQLLGSIEEFTTEPVNVDEVNRGGVMYCIDRRWHKAGNWFCIDVVPNASRYFYNHNKGVSIEISIKDVRAWKSVIG